MENFGQIVYVYNQIDYIICKQGQKHLITNAQSYGETKVCSDYKLVKTTFELSKYNIWKPTTRKRNNRELLGRDSETTKKYTTQLSELLSENDPSQSAKYQLDYVKQSIESAVNTNISETPRQKTFKIYDKEIQDLSELQKKLRIKIQNSKETNKTECQKKGKKLHFA
ncbi:hypothetical protein PoB_005061900 [Plakobranchus ocellatus]|uniref:Uncharacterized protein n=1 Tax=Plakobranchus ocellatus TaxID=259542 RepID=A0AAV4BZ26_9GAST|nr:hypothetical protein PoB_005061900 [Plakobranchus ocellatus]